jgi:hypothetical protein
LHKDQHHPTDYLPIKQMRLVRFDGARWATLE